MRSYTIIFLIFFTTINLFSQENKHSVSIYGQHSFIGNSIEFNYAYSNTNNNRMYVGIRLHAFDDIHVTDSEGYMFKDRFHPFETIQKIGLVIGDEYSFRITSSKLKPFLFYNMQVAYMGIHNEFRDPFETTDDDNVFINIHEEANPMFVFENNFGLGGKVKLFKNIDFAFRVGMGAAIINLTDTNYRLSSGTYIKFSKIGSLGLSYNF